MAVGSIPNSTTLLLLSLCQVHLFEHYCTEKPGLLFDDTAAYTWQYVQAASAALERSQTPHTTAQELMIHVHHDKVIDPALVKPVSPVAWHTLPGHGEELHW